MLPLLEALADGRERRMRDVTSELADRFGLTEEERQRLLLSRLKACSPAFFEKAVLRLLLAMGYGGVSGEGLLTGKSGDGGIDGLIREDKLGLDVVSLQAKRWEGSVGRPVVQGFVGSMDYVRSKKGGHPHHLGLHPRRQGLRRADRGQEGGADRRRGAGRADDRPQRRGHDCSRLRGQGGLQRLLR
jgi:restriction endonuclease Mrr